MRYLVTIALAIAISGCADIAVNTPDKSAVATYKGTVLFGDEMVSCTGLNGTETCTVSGRNVQAIAEALLPLVAKYFGLPSGAPPVTPAPQPSPAPTPSPPKPAAT